MYCDKCGGKIESTAGVCYKCTSDPVFYGPVFPCPQCARFRERMDREKMAKVLSDTAPWAASIKDFESWADELIKYLTE